MKVNLNKFEGQKCQMCGKEFKEKELVVVCPECGAPYHKECFKNNNECVFTEKHGEADGYTPDNNTEIVACSNCGKNNPKGREFCEFCNKQLNSKESTTAVQLLNNLDLRAKPTANSSEMAADEEKLIDAFVIFNTNYFKKAFQGQKKFNFGAFICPIFYYFYRKMYAAGSAFFVVILMLIYMICKQLRNFYSILMSGLESLGVNLDEFSSFDQLWTFVKINILNNIDIISLRRKANIVMFFLLLILVMMILSGFLTNVIYKNHIYNQIEKCRKISSDNYQKLIPIVGGVSLWSAILAFLSFIFCVIHIFQYFFMV